MITSVQAVCSTPLYVKGKTQDWPVVVLHAGDVVAGEQVRLLSFLTASIDVLHFLQQSQMLTCLLDRAA